MPRRLREIPTPRWRPTRADFAAHAAPHPPVGCPKEMYRLGVICYQSVQGRDPQAMAKTQHWIQKFATYFRFMKFQTEVVRRFRDRKLPLWRSKSCKSWNQHKSEELSETSEGFCSGGVLGIRRPSISSPEYPILSNRARRPKKITDADGKANLDFLCSYGPIILGHR